MNQGEYAAQDILNCSLTMEEVGRLIGIKHDFSNNIRWGNVADEALRSLSGNIEDLLHSSPGLLVRESPFDSLFPHEREFLEKEPKAQLRKAYIELLLVKKLLGAVKTKVNQHIQGILILDEEEEEELLGVVEDEMNPSSSTDGDVETEIIARINAEGSQCYHVDTIHRRVKANGVDLLHDEMQTYCKDCRTVVKRSVSLSKFLRGHKKKVTVCDHPDVKWVKGQEGQVAECNDHHNLKCTHTIEDPEKLKVYKWLSVGLEEVGDEPESDEVYVL